MNPESQIDIGIVPAQMSPDTMSGPQLQHRDEKDAVTIEALSRDVMDLRQEMNELKAELGIREVRELPKQAIRAIILEHLKGLKDGNELYPSDLATEYNLDGDAVEEVMDEMLEEGYFR